MVLQRNWESASSREDRRDASGDHSSHVHRGDGREGVGAAAPGRERRKRWGEETGAGLAYNKRGEYSKSLRAGSIVPWMDEQEEGARRARGPSRNEWGGGASSSALGGGGKGDRWGHDLFEEANRTPSPKPQELDSVDHIEALLAA